jgi:hypothetical protein
MKRMLVICLCLLFAFPVIVCARDDNATVEQKCVAEKFIAALKAGDYKTAHGFFTPDVRGRYPLPVFADIQNNVTRTMGSLTAYTYKNKRKADPPQGKDAAQPTSTYTYELTYKKDAAQTKIPLELTFGSGDSASQLLSYTYLKDKMKSGGGKK